MFSALIAAILGGVGTIAVKTSAEPENDVWARFPCFAIIRSGDAIMEEVVDMLNVE